MKELIDLYEQYIALLGNEILDLKQISKGFTSTRLKEGIELRKRIIELKNKIN
jgi:hypothetical protein